MSINSLLNTTDAVNSIKKVKVKESTQILSGMLLNHCLTYHSLDDDGLKFNPDEILIPTEINENDLNSICLLVFRFTTTSFIQSRIKKDSLHKFLKSSVSVQTSSNEDSILWLHVILLDSLPSIIDKYHLNKNIIKYFADSSSFARFYQLDEYSYLIQLITISMQDDIMNIKVSRSQSTHITIFHH